MASSDQIDLQICTRSALGPSTGHDLPLGELEAVAADVRKDGKIWCVSAFWLQFADTFDALSTMGGATPGERLHEFVDLVDLKSPAWPGRNIIRAGGRALRARSHMVLGKLPTADPADEADADASVTDQRRVLYIPFRRENSSFKGVDYAIPAFVFNDASLLLDLTQTPVTGINLTNTDVTLRAELIALSPRQHAFWRFMEQTPTQDTAFNFPNAGEVDAYAAAWCHIEGMYNSTGAWNQFAAATQYRLRMGGVEVLDGRITAQQLAEQYNVMNRDAAIDQTAATPDLLPLLLYGQGTKATKLHSGLAKARLEASTTIGHASNGTGNLMLLTEEILPGTVGSFEAKKYARAAGAAGPVLYRQDTASKQPMRLGALASRLPKKMVPLKRPMVGTLRGWFRGRYGK